MNKLYYIIIIILSLALNACSTYGTHLKFKPYKEKDYITKTLDIYEIDEILYPILDSLILISEKWPEYQNLKTKFAFSFDTGSLYIRDTQEISPNPHVLINVIMPRIYNFAEWAQGVFYYKDYSFYIDSMVYDILIHKTGRTTTITCIDPKKYQFDFHHRGDMDLYWWFEYKDGKLINSE